MGPNVNILFWNYDFSSKGHFTNTSGATSLDHPVAFLLQSCFNSVNSVRGGSNVNSNRVVPPPSLMVFLKVVHTLPFHSHIICSFLTVLTTPPTILSLPSIPQVQEGAEVEVGLAPCPHSMVTGVLGLCSRKALRTEMEK